MSKLADLKSEKGDREKVNAWLDAVGETDPVCREEVLEHCAKDAETRRYFVGRYEQDCIE